MSGCVSICGFVCRRQHLHGEAMCVYVYTGIYSCRYLCVDTCMFGHIPKFLCWCQDLCMCVVA